METVFPRMRADNVSLVAKKDFLICAMAARYIKIHRERHFAVVASRKMRELARFLIEIKKIHSSIKCLFDALKPKYFDAIITATKSASKYNVEKDVYDSPTYALNLGTALKHCCDLAIIYALKRKRCYSSVAAADAEADLRAVMHLIESQWKYEISSQAGNDLRLRKWNKVTIVPLASDLKLLKNYLIATATSAIKNLEKEPSHRVYVTLVETVFCRLVLLNRRRPGELQRLLLYVYERPVDETLTYEEFAEVISPTEKMLMKKFKRLVIRGKRGRGVPVLFSTDVQEHINVILKFRKQFVMDNNKYLFANVGTSEPICGYKVLKKHATVCKAINPSALTCTRLRKHLATLTQLFSMSDNDIEQLAGFMGHTVGVHKNSYRLPDDVYQASKITKLLLLMERGEAGAFKGKPLNEIDINLDENLLINDEPNNSDNDPMELNVTNETCSVDSSSYTVTTSSVVFDDIFSETDSTCTSLPPPDNKKLPKKKRVLVPWTKEQKEVVTKYFSNHIRGKKTPKRCECDNLKETHPELLKNKDWLKIKVFVQNIYNKK